MRLRLLLLLALLAGGLLVRARSATAPAAPADLDLVEPASPEAAVAGPPPVAALAAPAPAEAPARRRASVKRRLPLAALGLAQWVVALLFGRATGGYLPLYVASVAAWLATWLWTGLAWSEAPPRPPLAAAASGRAALAARPSAPVTTAIDVPDTRSRATEALRDRR